MSKKWLLKRAGSALVVLLAAMVINFALPRLMPGNPVDSSAGLDKLTEETRIAIKKKYGLDQPIWVQFGRYFVNTIKGDLGISFNYYPETVVTLIKKTLPWTLLIVLSSQIIQILAGYFLGVFAAWRVGGRFDTFVQSVSIVVFSTPIFWVGMVFLFIFGFQLGWFPLGGKYTPGVIFENRFEFILDVLKHAALPVVTFAISRFAIYQIIMRNTMISVLKEQYIITALAKGSSQFKVMHRHAARNAMLPMVTFAGVSLTVSVGASVYVETVFSYPGIGRLLYESIVARDYPMLQGSFFILALLVIVGTLIVDIIYLFLDPRIRY